MLSKFLAIVSLMILLSVLPIGCTTGDEGTVDVPVKVETARQVGAVVFYLDYDPAVLEATGVDYAGLTSGAEAAYNADTPGRLLVVIQNAPNIDRDGTLVIAHFKVLDEAGSSTLSIDVQEARDLNTYELLEPQVSEGSFAGPDASVNPPVMTFA